MTRYCNGTVSIFVCVALALAVAAPATAQNETALERIEARAVNKPLPSLAAAAAQARAKPPTPRPPREIVNFRGEGRPAPGGGPSLPDALLQTSPGSGETTIGTGFPGTANSDNGDLLGYIVAPPDTDGSRGPNHFVQMINSLTTIFNTNGTIASGPFASNVFWAGFGGNCEPYNQGDPIVLYDEIGQRWLVSQFAFPDSLGSFSQCVAISQTGDPTGAYNRYEFSFDGIGFNDYPKHGIVTDSITMIANLFTKRGRNFLFGGTFLGVMDKAAMYEGEPASLLGFNIGTGQFGFVAGDLDGAGTVPALFATAMSAASAFDIWRIDVNWDTENASVGQIASIPITPYDADLCSASRETCIPQPDGGPALEAISDRLMHRLQIRDFGGHRSMVTAHTVDVGNGRAGIRWYEFRESGGPWALYQEGTFGPDDSQHRFMPSAAMNATGDIGIGYLVSSSSTYLSTAVTGQSAGASGSGSFDSDELICVAGTGVQLDTGRSGDYSSTSVDPVQDTFWHTNEYVATTGQFNWATWVCEFSVGSGGSSNLPPTASFDYSCNELTCTFTDTSTDNDGSIASWSWDFGDNTSSMAQNPGHTYSAGGTYTVTLAVTDDDGASGNTSQNVTVTSQSTNTSPTASFTLDCTDLTCSFTDTSTDSDGSVVGWSWSFGDGGTSTVQNPSHTYAAGGTYTVTLTVTDDDSATDVASQGVTVTEPVTSNIILSAVGRKERGVRFVDLSWSGATGTSIDVIRDGAEITTTGNDGAYTDNLGRLSGTFVYQVCETDGSTCSNTASVTF